MSNLRSKLKEINGHIVTNSNKQTPKPLEEVRAGVYGLLGAQIEPDHSEFKHLQH